MLKREEVSKEFLTVRSFFDHGSLFEDLNVNCKKFKSKPEFISTNRTEIVSNNKVMEFSD